MEASGVVLGARGAIYRVGITTIIKNNPAFIVHKTIRDPSKETEDPDVPDLGRKPGGIHSAHMSGFSFFTISGGEI